MSLLHTRDNPVDYTPVNQLNNFSGILYIVRGFLKKKR